jgi:hypothetical protein
VQRVRRQELGGSYSKELVCTGRHYERHGHGSGNWLRASYGGTNIDMYDAYTSEEMFSYPRAYVFVPFLFLMVQQ